MCTIATGGHSSRGNESSPFTVACGSPKASHCYRGCGGRDDLAESLLSDRSVVGGGSNGGRIL